MRGQCVGANYIWRKRSGSLSASVYITSALGTLTRDSVGHRESRELHRPALSKRGNQRRRVGLGRYGQRVTKLRWGAEAPEDPTAARERLLDAAEVCFGRYGVMRTTMEAVAAQARVSRATVYRYFANREELVLGVLLREGERSIGRVAKKLARQPTFADFIVAYVLYTVDAIRTNPHLTVLFTPDAAPITGRALATTESALDAMKKFLRPYFAGAQAEGQMRPDVDVDDACEWIWRVCVSIVTVTTAARRSRAEQDRFLRAFLVPAFVPQDAVVVNSRRRRARNVASS